MCTRGHHYPVHARIVEQVVRDVLQVAPGAVLVRNSKLYKEVTSGCLEYLGEKSWRSLFVFRVDGVERIGPRLLFGRVARHLLNRGTYVAKGPIGLQDRDDVGSVLHHRAKVLFVTPEDLLSLLALCDVSGDDPHPSHMRVVQQVGAYTFYPPPRAVPVAEAVLSLVGGDTSLRKGLLSLLQHVWQVVGVDMVEHVHRADCLL